MKGIAALAHLPKLDFVFPTGNAAASIESFRALEGKLAEMQAIGTLDTDATYNGVIALHNNPYDSSEWNIVISGSGTTVSCFFVSETINEQSALGRAALTTRRAVDILKNTAAETYSLRSFLALLNFIESIEDRVAESGSGATGDGTYTTISLRGNTPFESYEWTVVKLADLYNCTSTANSN